jgi:hypothetical protein
MFIIKCEKEETAWTDAPWALEVYVISVGRLWRRLWNLQAQRFLRLVLFFLSRIKIAAVVKRNPEQRDLEPTRTLVFWIPTLRCQKAETSLT